MTVRLDTLTSIKGSVLTELFSEMNQLPTDLDDGESFKIDRDPVIFEQMIDYLRRDRKFIPNDLSDQMK